MRRFIKVSTSIHVTVLVLIIVWPSVFSRKYKQKMLPVYTVELVSPQEFVTPAIRPKTANADQRLKTKKKYPVRKKRSVLKPSVQKLKTPTLEEKLSRKLKDIEEPVARSKPVVSQKMPSYTPKFKATISSVSDFQFQWYLSFIQGKISSCWHQPQMVIAKQYSAMVSFNILKDGSVRNVKIKRSSGMLNFDNSAVQAVELAEPLPPLPPDYKFPQLVVNVDFRLE